MTLGEVVERDTVKLWLNDDIGLAYTVHADRCHRDTIGVEQHVNNMRRTWSALVPVMLRPGQRVCRASMRQVLPTQRRRNQNISSHLLYDTDGYRVVHPSVNQGMFSDQHRGKTTRSKNPSQPSLPAWPPI